ncbi:hypothetical protein CTI12_AA522610 [Artemisia annua]|uniref:Uncharacterized protein n=1 Tax=Artemisia annua TaxID=35608 RepID=A0A2U1L7C8_ARTAN|nr:hypothetical protein CTI12_AA522610 [Artemisia annua]
MEGHDARFKRIGSTLLWNEPFEWSNDTSLAFFAAAIDEDEEDTAGSSRCELLLEVLEKWYYGSRRSF